ncbi:UDPglucose 6-dehydrogenase [Herbihabitans rhizosphaerae]|uniref:UDP-glucose 6-dehydrogenase n=1 Tax=Herbihabitans rhizosphaerae TaxID=1872711 RepID=A0A4Q7KLG2_9PSEU|nr:UDP-glucose/GDP-mannose dehydrogenase family protein [Herbihabitans rhizosphaerae]RZS37498.1 UDPglucose 6-dehydrogenase [Herbihabitans rhizosphaerae]
MSTRRVIVVGTGYVGLTTGACLASVGHRVTCADIDPAKIARLRAGQVDILETGLAELVSGGTASGNLDFVLGARPAVVTADGPVALFLCVPTPMGAGGEADLRAVESVVGEIADVLPAGSVLVTKSTVPVGTAARVADMLGRDDIAVVSNPEFLREGSAVSDFLNPDRVVVGSDDRAAAELVGGLYDALNAPVVVTDAASAEMVKYAANCYLATKLSYVNAIAGLCERLGADVEAVIEGMGHDPRIGRSFLRPGPGWGGSCLPKDTRALAQVAEAAGYAFPLLDAAIDTNLAQHAHVVAKVRRLCGGALAGARIGLLGVAFKAGTNDLRDSPALAVAELLAAEGAELTAYDPAVNGELSRLSLVDDPYLAVKGADVVVVLTEWPEFATLDWSLVAELMAGQSIVDTRNLLPLNDLRAEGLACHPIGRAPVVPAARSL